MTWLDLYRWFHAATVWICSCGCLGPDCCECCLWWAARSQDDRREARILEHAFQHGMFL